MFIGIFSYLSQAIPEIDRDSRIAFSIGNIDIMWYAIIILSGAIIGTLYGYYRFAKRLGLDSDTVITGLTLGLIFGIIGARLYYVIFTASSREIVYDSFWEVINPRDGGLAIHGAIIATAIYLPIFCKVKKIKLLYLLEIAMPLILFAQVVGRWGNFMNQEAFGGLVQVEGLKSLGDITRNTILSEEILLSQREALSKLLIPNFVIDRMYISSSSASGFLCAGYYYPTFYFESILNLIGIVIYMISRKYFKKILVGDGISFYLIWYGIVRFFIETMRTDPLVIGNTGIKVAELTSIIYIILGILWIIIRRIKKYQMISCYDALYKEGSSMMTDDYEKKEPTDDFITKLFKKITRKRKSENETNNK